jgi:hypothetical protein
MTAKKPQDALQKVGRKSLYTPELVEKICELIASGKSEYEIAGKDGIPSTTTLWNWKKANPEFLELSACARVVSADVYDAKARGVDELLLKIALEYLKKGEPIPSGIVDALKAARQGFARSAALRNDELFGDRKRVSIDAKVDGGGLADVYAKIAEAVKGEQE